MANHRRGFGNGRIPSGNGDPFQTFVIRELRGLRNDLDGFREQQDRNWAEQRIFWKHQHAFNDSILKLVTDLAQAVHGLTHTVDGLVTRMDRQDRINRLILKEFKRLRRG